MRLFYSLIMAASLTACASPDAQRAAPPVASQSPPGSADATVAAGPVAPAQLARQPATLTRHRPAPPRRPTTYADAPAANAKYVYELPDPKVAEEPRPVGSVTDTTGFGEIKAAQIFRIRPGRDTVLFGREGTVIGVPAGAFVQATPGAPEPTGSVEVQLKELYSLPDILLNNLSTSSSHGPLETGGMLHLAAHTASGQPCVLRPGTELLLRMPAPRPKPGMQLFAGVRAASHRLDWQRPRPALAPTEFLQNGPTAPDGDGPLLALLRQRVGFSAEAARRLRATQTRPQRRALRRGSRFSGHQWVDYGQLVVAVDRRGAVVNATMAGLRDSVLGARLCAVARQLPAFRPATLSGPVRSGPTAPTRSYLTISRKRRTAPVPLVQLPVAGTWAVKVGFARDGQVWFPELSTSYANEPDGPGQQQVFQVDSARQHLRQTGTKALQATSLDTLSGYLFSAASLGWANCDRTGQFGSRRILFTVKTDAPDTRVNLVFKRVRTVIASDGERPGTRLQQFHSSPVGEAATLVAIKREGGSTYLALKDVVLTEQVEQDLPFRLVSAEELRNALAKLDQ